MLPISVCMISKNEEQHIDECLKRLKPYRYEIVLVDTGSTDRTVEIASKYTDKIYHFEWVNDFSAARNFSFAQASNDWVLVIDCDDYVESIDEKKLLELMTNNPRSIGQILTRNRFIQDGQTSYENVYVSRFMNRKYYQFEGKIHEQFEPLSADIQKKYFRTPVIATHVGYDGPEEEMRAKSLRNITLLEEELKTTGPDAYLYYQLGQSCMKIKDYEKAYEWFDLGLSMDVEPALDYVQTMVESYGYCLLNLKRYEEALQLVNIYDVFAIRADFVFLMGLIYMNNGLLTEAIDEFKKATTMEQFCVDGINSCRPNYNIGVIYECTGKLELARKYYKKCGKYEPAKARLKVIGN